MTQTINPAGGDASIYAPIPPKKPTSKLAVWGIIIGALFAFLAFASDSGPSWFLGFIAALLSGHVSVCNSHEWTQARTDSFVCRFWDLSSSAWL